VFYGSFSGNRAAARAALSLASALSRAQLLRLNLHNITVVVHAEEMVSPRSSSPRSPAPAATRSNALNPPDSKGFSTLYVCCCVSFYFVVSLSLTFLNKTVLSTFECPLFMTWLQFLVAFSCLKCLGFLGLFSSLISKDIGIHDYSFSTQTFMKTLPLGVSYVAM
jgi:hypothetical protein